MISQFIPVPARIGSSRSNSRETLGLSLKNGTTIDKREALVMALL
jgi:hypothetical protein